MEKCLNELKSLRRVEIHKRHRVGDRHLEYLSEEHYWELFDWEMYVNHWEFIEAWGLEMNAQSYGRWVSTYKPPCWFALKIKLL
jgi:hypothetical protein